MRKSQQKPVSEKRWTFDENEKPEKRLGDIREKFEHMIVDGPPVKNGMAQTVKRLPTMREIGVRSLGGEDPLKKEMATHSNTLAWKIPWEEPVTGFKSDVHHSGEDHNINHKIQVDNHGKIFEIHEKSAPGFKSQVLNVRVDQNRNSQNQGTGYKSHVLHSGVDQNRNVPNQGILGKKFAPQESSEKAPVKSDKGEQDIDKLQIKIDDLQKKIGDLLKKIDKGENDKYNLLKQIGDLVRKLDKAEQDRDDLLRILEKTPKKDEEISATIGDLLKKLDKGEQDRDVLREKIEKMKQEKDEIAQEKNEIAQEKEVLKHNLEKMKQEKDEIAQEKEQLKKEIERKRAQFKSSWRDIPLYADWRKEEFQTVNLTLDAATAHPSLFLSEEGRRVTWQEPCQELPSSPERFVSIPCVLGQLHVNSGRYFWEVEVQNVHSWDLGVCMNNVERNGRVTMSPQNGFWAIRLYNGGYWGLTSPETSLTLKEKPLYVGVFLDYEAGDVSFYNMKDGSHIYTFSKQTFYGVLRPLFRLWSSDSGPLTIVQVE